MILVIDIESAIPSVPFQETCTVISFTGTCVPVLVLIMELTIFVVICPVNGLPGRASIATLLDTIPLSGMELKLRKS